MKCLIALAAAEMLAGPVDAQEALPGRWEFGAHLLHLDATQVPFDGGSSISTSDEFGFAMSVGYRLTERLEMHFALEAQSVGYHAAIQSDRDGRFDRRGDLDVVSPRLSATLNLLDADLTPYVTAGVGWTFIDTNIPNGPVHVDCFWDPWWGYICGYDQDTRTLDEFSYQAGVGMRWDFSPGYTMRLGYEKQWLDLSHATRTPDFDQFKIGIAFRY